MGDTIKAEVTCDKFGKTLAYTSIKFMNAKDELVARGSHTKSSSRSNGPTVMLTLWWQVHCPRVERSAKHHRRTITETGEVELKLSVDCFL